jgi:ABC-type sugar transport system substrate-binding protein
MFMKLRGRKRRYATIILVSIIATLVLAACGDPTATSAPAATTAGGGAATTSAEKKLIIGFVPQNIQDPGFRSMQRAMIREGNKYGYTLKAGDAENSVEKQPVVIDNIVASGVDCLVIRARNQTTLQQSAANAKAKGIPVVANFDEFTGADSVVAFDQFELGKSSGKLGGQYLKENFGGKGDVIVINADSLGGTTVDRAKGIVAGIKEATPDARIVSNQEALTQDKALEVVSSALQANPNTRVVVAINDSTARGALAALKNAGKNVPKDAVVVAIAGEGVLETLELIKSGQFYGTTSAALIEVAEKSVQVCRSLSKKENVEKKIVVGPLKVITAANVDEQIKFVTELNKISVS